MATTFERVRSVIVEELGVEEDQVKPESSFVDDLGADSIAMAGVCMAAEEVFCRDGAPLEISVEAAGRIHSVPDAVDHLRALGVEDE